MSFSIAELEKNKEALNFLASVTEKNNQAMIMNKAKLFIRPKNYLWANIVIVKIPPIYYLSIVFLGLYFLFGGWGWFIPMVFFALTYIPFSRAFHVYAFKRGIRKAGYSGTIKIVNFEQGIMEVLFNESNRGL